MIFSICIETLNTEMISKIIHENKDCLQQYKITEKDVFSLLSKDQVVKLPNGIQIDPHDSALYLSNSPSKKIVILGDTDNPR